MFVPLGVFAASRPPTFTFQTAVPETSINGGTAGRAIGSLVQIANVPTPYPMVYAQAKPFQPGIQLQPSPSEPENLNQINKGRWTKREQRIFEEGFRRYGKEWKLIAQMIKTRTVIQIRTHAQKYFQKLAKQNGGPVMSTSKKEKLHGLPPGFVHPSANELISQDNLDYPIKDNEFRNKRKYNLRKEPLSKRLKVNPSNHIRRYSFDQLMGSASEKSSVTGEDIENSSDRSKEVTKLPINNSAISRELEFYNKDKPQSPGDVSNEKNSGRVTPTMLAAATVLIAPQMCDKISMDRLSWARSMLATKRC